MDGVRWLCILILLLLAAFSPVRAATLPAGWGQAVYIQRGDGGGVLLAPWDGSAYTATFDAAGGDYPGTFTAVPSGGSLSFAYVPNSDPDSSAVPFSGSALPDAVSVSVPNNLSVWMASILPPAGFPSSLKVTDGAQTVELQWSADNGWYGGYYAEPGEGQYLFAQWSPGQSVLEVDYASDDGDFYPVGSLGASGFSSNGGSWEAVPVPEAASGGVAGFFLLWLRQRPLKPRNR